jgi:hypothetical protein
MCSAAVRRVVGSAEQRGGWMDGWRAGAGDAEAGAWVALMT